MQPWIWGPLGRSVGTENASHHQSQPILSPSAEFGLLTRIHLRPRALQQADLTLGRVAKAGASEQVL